MAVCDRCHGEMMTATTCIPAGFVGSRDAKPIRYGDEPGLRALFAEKGEEIPERCHDCGCTPGGYHHAYCDMEVHPVNGDQAMVYKRFLLPTA